MVILIAGPSHTGKTALAQRLLEKYHYPYFSIDHLKMGLIRSGQTSLSASSPEAALTGYLWPIVREVIKTVIENKQNIIIEGCYIPFDWKKSFEESYRDDIRCIRLVMSENYIRTHFDDIIAYANVVEKRVNDSYCTMEFILKENQRELHQCIEHGEAYLYIDSDYAPEDALSL